jgi:hypothetical protein
MNVMNKVRILALSAIIALVLTACSNADNNYYEHIHTYYQTENFTSVAGSYTVELKYMKGQPVVEKEVADWVTVTALPNSGEEPSKVEIAVKENASGAERTTLQTITVGEYTVKLTINQGFTTVENPNEEETDQPAYSPVK